MKLEKTFLISPSFIDFEVLSKGWRAVVKMDNEEKISLVLTYLEAYRIIYLAGEEIDSVYQGLRDSLLESNPKPSNIDEAVEIIFKTYNEFFVLTYVNEIRKDLSENFNKNYFKEGVEQLELRKTIKDFMKNLDKVLQFALDNVYSIYMKMKDMLEKGDRNIESKILKTALVKNYNIDEELLLKYFDFILSSYNDKSQGLCNSVGPFEYYIADYIVNYNREFIKTTGKKFYQEGIKRLNKFLKDYYRGISQEARKKMKEKADELIWGKDIKGKPWPWKVAKLVAGAEDFLKDKLGVKYDRAKIDPMANLLIKGASALIKQISLRKGSGESYKILEYLDKGSKWWRGHYDDDFKGRIDIKRELELRDIAKKKVLEMAGMSEKEYEEAPPEVKAAIEARIINELARMQRSRKSKEKELLVAERTTKKNENPLKSRIPAVRGMKRRRFFGSPSQAFRRELPPESESKSIKKEDEEESERRVTSRSSYENIEQKETNVSKPVVKTQKPAELTKEKREQKYIKSEREQGTSIDANVNDVVKKTYAMFNKFFVKLEELIKSIQVMFTGSAKVIKDVGETSVRAIEDVAKSGVYSKKIEARKIEEPVKAYKRVPILQKRFSRELPISLTETLEKKRKGVIISSQDIGLPAATTVSLKTKPISSVFVGKRVKDFLRIKEQKAALGAKEEGISAKRTYQAMRIGKPKEGIERIKPKGESLPKRKHRLAKIKREKPTVKKMLAARRSRLGRASTISSKIARRAGVKQAADAATTGIFKGIGGKLLSKVGAGGLLGAGLSFASMLYSLYTGYKGLKPTLEKLSGPVGREPRFDTASTLGLTEAQAKALKLITGQSDFFNKAVSIESGESARGMMASRLALAQGNLPSTGFYAGSGVKISPIPSKAPAKVDKTTAQQPAKPVETPQKVEPITPMTPKKTEGLINTQILEESIQNVGAGLIGMTQNIIAAAGASAQNLQTIVQQGQETTQITP